MPGSGLSTCGDLISTDGQPPDWSLVDTSGDYRLRSDGLTDDGLTQLVAVRTPACGSFSVPVRVDNNEWYPDVSRMFGPAIGCLIVSPTNSFSPPGPDSSWIMDLFASPMLVTMPDSETVRVAAADPATDVYLDFRWA